ncbi:MAG: M91 family zinc metallopeptidase [bacterium]
MTEGAIGYAIDSHEITTYGNSIIIEETPEFRQRVAGDLNVIASTPTGGVLLNDIDKSGKITTIRETSKGNGEDAINYNNGVLQPDGTHGTGTDSIINYNPDRKKLNGEPWQTRPPEVGLAHELIHSCHDAYGTTDGTKSVGYTNLIDGATEFDPYLCTLTLLISIRILRLKKLQRKG